MRGRMRELRDASETRPCSPSQPPHPTSILQVSTSAPHPPSVPKTPGATPRSSQCARRCDQAASSSVGTSSSRLRWVGHPPTSTPTRCMRSPARSSAARQGYSSPTSRSRQFASALPRCLFLTFAPIIPTWQTHLVRMCVICVSYVCHMCATLFFSLAPFFL